MGHYRNFNLAVYFVAQGTKSATKEQLENDLDFFEKYIHLDKVYLEQFREGPVASQAQVDLVKDAFARRSIRVCGGLTTATPTPAGSE